MSPNEAVIFGIMLFLSLVLLIEWKRRRDLIARRLNDGLRGYVSGKPLAMSGKEDAANEDMRRIGIVA